MNNRRPISIATGLLAVIACCSACAVAVAAPEAVPAPTPATAPRVSHPLDASKMLAKPCSALTAADLAALGVDQPLMGDNSNSTGKGCGWTGMSGGSVGVSWLTPETNGLSDAYARAYRTAYFQPTTVLGYPAAWGDVGPDDRANGACSIDVGVTDHLYFETDSDSLATAQQACDRAWQIAVDVIRNLGGS